MGDPKKQRKKYQGPGHPWQGERITEERASIREYGLKNKKEIWKVTSLLRNWRSQARNIASLPEKERNEAQKILLAKLTRLGLVKKDSHLDDVLSLTTKDILERRLQTLVHKQGMSNSIQQARQFVAHNKIVVDSKPVPSPAQLIKINEKIGFTQGFKPILNKIVAEKPVKAPTQEVPIKKQVAQTVATNGGNK